MTKLLFVSDIHLNLRKNKEWELNRFYELANEISQISADLLILGGDIFDKSHPNLDEIAAFYTFIDKVKPFYKQIIVISGNHEDLSSKETCFHKLPQVGFTYIEFTERPALITDNVALYFVSHHKIQSIKDIQVSDKANLLFSHIRANIGVVKAEASLSKISKQFDEIILGDIHVPYKPYENVEYCGSPYTIQYENKRDTGVFLIKLEKGKIKKEFVSLAHLPQKIRYDLSVEEYKKILPYLDKRNLYKIVLYDNVKNLDDLVIPHNVSIVFNSVLNEKELEEEVSEIKKVGHIDVIDTLLKLVKTNEHCDDEVYQAGEKIINEFRRGVL